MSSHDDRRRRERSWERNERDSYRDRDRDRTRGGQGSGRARGHRSKSRSPPRRNDQSKRDHDYGRDRYDDTRRDRERNSGYYDRERDRRSDRRRDEKLGRDSDRREKDTVDSVNVKKEEEPNFLNSSRDDRDSSTLKQSDKDRGGYHRDTNTVPSALPNTSILDPKNEPDLKEEEDGEEGEEMEVDNQIETEDDAAMMAMMGFGGFDSTKGKSVTGNQEGIADLKKPRTWRQYMNRRGGFNRPLDKIK